MLVIYIIKNLRTIDRGDSDCRITDVIELINMDLSGKIPGFTMAE